MYSLLYLVLAIALKGVVTMGQVFTCPGQDGYYPDPLQCDKYYDCSRGKMEEKLCPDGLVFDASLGPRVSQCNYPFIVECPEGATLQQPKSHSVECPRENGYFEHEDPANCEQYYECTYGQGVLRTCATGLVFDELTGTCVWATSGLRSGCTARKEVLADGFSCPSESQVAASGHQFDHARYPKADDCRIFYVCYDGKTPSMLGCPEGTVFNDLSLNCDSPENVRGCENYYPPESNSRSIKA